MLYFTISKCVVVSSKSSLTCEAGCGLTVSWSDHARIMVGSCSDHGWIMVGSAPALEMDVSSVFGTFAMKICSAILCGRRSIW